MRRKLQSLMVLLFLIGIAKLSAQVTAVRHQIRYNTDSCYYEAFTVVTSGSANITPQRITGSSSYSIVTDSNREVVVVRNFNPRENLTGTGNPVSWSTNATNNSPSVTPNRAYNLVVNNTNTTATYPSLQLGDTIRLFAFRIKSTLTQQFVDYKCGNTVRPFNSTVSPNDPSSTAPGMNQQQFANGFVIGGGQVYAGNLDTRYPPPVPMTLTNVCSSNLIVDLQETASMCYDPLSYNWQGPNGYTSTSQDVSIIPATINNNGVYTVTVTDKFGCTTTSSITANIKPNAGQDQIACPGSTVTLNGTNPNTGTWTTSPTNASGATLTSGSSGSATVSFDQGASGQYAFIYTVNNCPDTVLVNFGAPDGGEDPANVSCFSTGSAQLAASGTGTWSLAPGNPGTAIFSNASSPTSTATFSAPGTYTLRWSTGPCFDEVTVIVQNNCSCTAGNNTLTQPNPSDFCGSAPATSIVGGSATPAGGSYVWQYSLNSAVYSPAPGANTNQNYTTPTLSVGSHRYRRIYNFTDGQPCSDTSNVVTITVNPAPPTPNGSNVIGSNPTTCGGTDGAINLSGLVAGTTYTLNYTSKGIPVTTSITTTGSGTFAITGLSSGNYTNFSYTGANGCVSPVFAGPVILTDPGSPAAPTITAAPNPACAGQNVALTATGVAGATYTWTVSNAAAGLGSNTSSTNTMTSPAVGSYTVSVTQSAGSCISAPGTVTVVVSPSPPMLTASNFGSNNPTACATATGSITISGLTAGTTYMVTYQKNGQTTNVSLTANASGVINISNLTSGTYTNFSISIGGNCSSNTFLGPISLVDPNSPPAPLNITAAPNPACIGEVVSLSVDAITGTAYTWTASPANSGIVPSTSNSTSMTATAAGTYVVSVTGTQNGCTSVPSTISVQITDGPATPTMPNITAINPTSCSGTNGQITIRGYTPLETYTITYTSQGSTIVNSVTANDAGAIVLMNLTSGSYINISLESSNGCASGVFAGPVILVEPGAPGVPVGLMANPNPSCLGETINLSLVNNALATYNWAASNVASGLVTLSTTNMTTMTPTQPGLYTISVTQTVGGCTSPPASIQVQVRAVCNNPDFGVTYKNVPLTGDLSTNDGQTGYSYSNVIAKPGNPSSCLPSINSDGTYTFSCPTIGEYSYTVDVCYNSQIIRCEKVALEIAVMEVDVTNNPPMANHDYSSTNSNNDVLIRILANDKCQSVPDCNLMTPTIVTQPSNGVFTVATGLYRPNAGFIGRDSFRYEVCQSPSVSPTNCDQEWVYINVFGPNSTQFTNGMDDYNQTLKNTTLVATVPQGSGANDTDPLDLAQTIKPFTKTVANKGTLTMNSNGSYTFVPIADFTGPVDFPYEVCRTIDNTVCDSATLHLLVDPSLPTSDIGDFVWNDLNGNGIQEMSEPGIPGAIVTLINSLNFTVATTTTDNTGKYLFKNVQPGNYYIRFVTDVKFSLTRALQGIDRTKDSDVTESNGRGTTNLFTVVVGQSNLTIDAGYFECVKIGDNVWYDNNRNDVFDINENGVNGIRVKLFKREGGQFVLWEEQVTGHKPNTGSDDGYYQFCAPPGTYYIKVQIPPTGLVLVRPFIGNNRFKDSDIDGSNGPGTSPTFTLNAGQNKLDLGAGYYPMAIVGNLVWEDINNDGVQDPNEPRVAGVNVKAYDANSGEMLGESTTNAEGKYVIDYLEKREVYLKFDPPAGSYATVAGATIDAEDSDVDHTFGINTTRSFLTASGVNNANIDLGLASSILPLTWTSVSGLSRDEGNEISWRTGSEINVQEFIIERRSSQDLDFKVLSHERIRGKNSTSNSYSFLDTHIDENTQYYYRIKQVDFDGKSSYSKEVRINRDNEGAFSMYPNPFKDRVNIAFTTAAGIQSNIKVFSAEGRVVFEKSIYSDKSEQLYENILASEWPSGMYTVKIFTGAQSHEYKIIKL